VIAIEAKAELTCVLAARRNFRLPKVQQCFVCSDENQSDNIDAPRVTYRLVRLAIAQLLAAVAVVAAPNIQVRSQSGAIWTVPEIGALPRDAHGLQIREGRDLVTATYAHIGPNVPDESKRYAGNNLACSNCHLQAGTKKFGLPLFGLYGDFPQYSARSGDDISIEDRINSCMTRSMNGRPLPTDARRCWRSSPTLSFSAVASHPANNCPGSVPAGCRS
jgi:hypothetical protein